MSVSAEFKMEATKLLYQQSTECTAALKNAGTSLLREVNAMNQGGCATLVLTDVATGDVWTFARPVQEGLPPQDTGLPRGESIKDEFLLSDRVTIPAPGIYDLQAHYEWGMGDEVDSPPVRLEILESKPRNAYATLFQPPPVPLYLIAWVNVADPIDGPFQVWLSHVTAMGRSIVRQSFFVEEVDQIVQPILSAPPTGQSGSQWVAWLEGNRLVYACNMGSEVYPTSKCKLDDAAYRLIPPLMLNPTARGKTTSGFDALLYDSEPGAPGGALSVVHCPPSGDAKVEDPIAIPLRAPAWAATAHLEGFKRYTFLMNNMQGNASMGVAPWSATTLPKTVDQIASWPAKCLACDFTVMEGDEVHGAMVGESGAGGARSYAFYRWRFNAPDQFQDAQKITIGVPEGVGIGQAVVRVNIDGVPHAMLRTDDTRPTWYFCGPDGNLKALPDDAKAFRMPGDILFHRGTTPMIIFGEPPRGFQIVKPD